MTILYDDLPVIHGTGEVLRDKKTNWRKLRLKTEAVGHAILTPESYWAKRSERILDCGAYLKFAVDNSGNMRLIFARFCKDRLCPSCQKRRSLMMFHQVKDVCTSIQQENPKMQYLLLTLTVPNVKYTELKSELDHLTKSFKRLTERAIFKRSISGFFRALEITYNGKRDDYHPHYHVLLCVPPSYFKKNYISQSTWLQLWREATRNDLITQVDVRRVKPNPKRSDSTSIETAAAEVGKYATKPSNYLCELPNGEYLASGKIIRELAECISGRRLVAFGGLMKEHMQKLSLQDVESDEADLVHVSGDSDLIDAVMVQVFRWNVGLRQYMN
jgi:plasmid rolling circle replication initiator protein Rep